MTTRTIVSLWLVALGSWLWPASVWAQIRPKDYPTATNLLGTDILVVTQNPGATNESTRKLTITQVGQAIGAISVSNSAVLYVSPTGSDISAERGNPNRPWGSISNALRVLTNGDTLKIMPGWYTNTALIHAAGGDAPWMVRGVTNVFIDASGAETYWPTQLSAMVIRECNGVTVRGLGFHNKKVLPPATWLTDIVPSQGTFAALTIVNSEHVLIEGCRFRDLWDHGIVANGDCAGKAVGDNNTSNDVCVSRCSFENLGFGAYLSWPDGAAVVPGPGQKITDNYISNTGRGVEVYPMPDTDNSAEGRSITITGNHLYKTAGEAIMVIRVGGGVVSDNTIDNPEGFTVFASFDAGIKIEYCKNVVFSGNSIRNKTYPGILIQFGNTNLTFIGNSLRQCGFILGYAKMFGCRFVENTITDSSYSGMSINDDFQGNEISRNRFQNIASAGYGISVSGGVFSSNRIDGNVFWSDTAGAGGVALKLHGGVTASGNRWFNNRLDNHFTVRVEGGTADSVIFEGIDAGTIDLAPARISSQEWDIGLTNVQFSDSLGFPAALILGSSLQPYVGIALWPDDWSTDHFTTLSLYSDIGPTFGNTLINIRGETAYFKGTLYATSGVVSGGVVSWPTNTVNTPPVFALGQFGYWNSNGLMLWKCWNTNGTTVCRPTLP
jgi:hypothetical protein